MASDISISLPDGMIAVPAIANIQFLDAPWLSLSLKLLNEFELATCLKTVQIIDKYIIPSWNISEAANWPYSCREQLATVILSQYSCLSLASQAKLRALPMIPVARINGEATSKFSVAADFIDPSISALKELFFDDEEVVPESNFFKQFHACLSDIGLRGAVDETLISSRARYYASSNRPVSEVEKCVHRLLASPCSWDAPMSNSECSELRQLKWLPVLDHEGNLGLRSPKQCRGLRDQLLVSSQLPVFNVPVFIEWESRLGWLDILPNHVLLGQLNHGLRTEDRAVVDAILTYIVENAQTRLLIDDLGSLPFILTSTGLYVTASKVFLPTTSRFAGCERLHPYLGNIDNKFWQDHKILLTEMKIGNSPSPDDLLGVQKVLESQLPLSESDVAVAIEILHLASRFPRTSLAGLKALNKAGEFCPVQDINYNDLGALTPAEEVNLTHPDIPSIIAKRLGIELLSERLMKGMLEIADIDDDDEFEQQEQITTRIVDTLGRYPIDNTFREYLANADDTAGTSKVSWLLDERTHAHKKLLTAELRTFQGPALLVHNDGG
jgi:sacsin